MTDPPAEGLRPRHRRRGLTVLRPTAPAQRDGSTTGASAPRVFRPRKAPAKRIVQLKGVRPRRRYRSRTCAESALSKAPRRQERVGGRTGSRLGPFGMVLCRRQDGTPGHLAQRMGPTQAPLAPKSSFIQGKPPNGNTRRSVDSSSERKEEPGSDSPDGQRRSATVEAAARKRRDRGPSEQAATRRRGPAKRPTRRTRAGMIRVRVPKRRRDGGGTSVLRHPRPLEGPRRGTPRQDASPRISATAYDRREGLPAGFARRLHSREDPKRHRLR
jgi:hypothetical protein